MLKPSLPFTLAVATVLVRCGNNESQSVTDHPDTTRIQAMTFQITSPSFDHEGMIPSKFTCDSSNVSPELQWMGTAAGTRSFALICDDPDASRGTWVHWVIYNIPGTSSGLPESVSSNATLRDGMRQGVGSSNHSGYRGPCPPSGIHRYYFKLYGLDAQLDLAPGATKEQLLAAMEGHILAEAQLMGRYTRKG